MQINLQSLNR